MYLKELQNPQKENCLRFNDEERTTYKQCEECREEAPSILLQQ